MYYAIGGLAVLVVVLSIITRVLYTTNRRNYAIAINCMALSAEKSSWIAQLEKGVDELHEERRLNAVMIHQLRHDVLGLAGLLLLVDPDGLEDGVERVM